MKQKIIHAWFKTIQYFCDHIHVLTDHRKIYFLSEVESGREWTLPDLPEIESPAAEGDVPSLEHDN